MRRLGKSFAVLLVLATLAAATILQPTIVEAQPNASNSSTPAIAWEKQYGDRVAFVSNLIQTSDGGYAFLDLGWTFQFNVLPSTLYKVDSSGDVQWKKSFDSIVFSASYGNLYPSTTIIQTSDEGYEISGYNGLRGGDPYTVIKTNSTGNIEWTQTFSNDTLPTLSVASQEVPTTDGGFIYAGSGNLTKTNADNETQWTDSVTFDVHYTFTEHYDTYPLELSSLVETSDGAIAGIGVGHQMSDNILIGSICLIKTQPFLPLPSQTLLPTPITTPSTTVGNPALAPVLIVAASAIAAVVGLLLYRRQRKTF